MRSVLRESAAGKQLHFDPGRACRSIWETGNEAENGREGQIAPSGWSGGRRRHGEFPY
jgi:hypothetical protein